MCARAGWDKGDISLFSSFSPAAAQKIRWGFPAGGQKFLVGMTLRPPSFLPKRLEQKGIFAGGIIL